MVTDRCPSCSRPWDGSKLVGHNDTSLVPPQARTAPLMTATGALGEHCNIFESFLATNFGDGGFAYASGPSPEEDIKNWASSGDDIQEGYEKYDTDDYSTRTSFLFQDCWLGPSKKRQRRQGRMRRELDDDAPSIIVNSRKTLMVGDAKAVMEFYDHSFREIQQGACKEVAKSFVKILCPRKQRTFPYVGGDAAAPDWWPDTVRHVEPDHLLKKERIHLLKHILWLIINPEARAPSIQKLGSIIVARFEAAAMDSLEDWFAIKPKNARKKPILKRLFRVAKMEERYKRNEIDATTEITVDPENEEGTAFVSSSPPKSVFSHQHNSWPQSPHTPAQVTSDTPDGHFPIFSFAHGLPYDYQHYQHHHQHCHHRHQHQHQHHQGSSGGLPALPSLPQSFVQPTYPAAGTVPSSYRCLV